MNNSVLCLLACPKCLGELQFAESGTVLFCTSCGLRFPVVDGVPFFGINVGDSNLKWQEIDAELKWMLQENDLKEHLEYASMSAETSRRMIMSFASRIPKKTRTALTVLDLGSGACMQSWQLSQFGFKVISVELVPEFLFAVPNATLTERIQRICSDLQILPFRPSVFDIVFCKESLHHVRDLDAVLHEVLRVCKVGGSIILKEPAWPITKNKLHEFAKGDCAAQAGITHAYHNYAEYISVLDSYCEVSVQSLAPAKDRIERQLEWFGNYSRKTPPLLKPFIRLLRSIYIPIRNSIFPVRQVIRRGGSFVIHVHMLTKPPILSVQKWREIVSIDPQRLSQNSEQLALLQKYNQAIFGVFQKNWVGHNK